VDALLKMAEKWASWMRKNLSPLVDNFNKTKFERVRGIVFRIDGKAKACLHVP
jgi:hypothetical protein